MININRAQARMRIESRRAIHPHNNAINSPFILRALVCESFCPRKVAREREPRRGLFYLHTHRKRALVYCRFYAHALSGWISIGLLASMMCVCLAIFFLVIYYLIRCRARPRTVCCVYDAAFLRRLYNCFLCILVARIYIQWISNMCTAFVIQKISLCRISWYRIKTYILFPLIKKIKRFCSTKGASCHQSVYTVFKISPTTMPRNFKPTINLPPRCNFALSHHVTPNV